MPGVAEYAKLESLKMKTFKIVLVVLGTLAVVLVAVFFAIGYLKPKPSGLLVDTTPESSVYVNGNFAGKTPFNSANFAGQIDLKLVPDIADQNLVAYETKINLVPGIQTVVRREFGPSEDSSSGDVISFDKSGTGIIVISSPDNAQVLVNGTQQGFTPYNISPVTPGSYQITVKADGFMERTMSIKTQPDYRLTVYAKLAKAPVAVPTASPTPQPVSKTFVVVGNTPTGFLRMRTEPATNGEEIAELKTGSKYLYLETDAASGWYKIQYQDPAPGLPNGMVGWVSNQYSSLATQSASIKQ